MAEPKSTEKYYPYTLKQEGFDTFNWSNMEQDFDERNSNLLFFNKINNNQRQMFPDFSLPMNQELNTEEPPLINKNEHQTPLSEQPDPNVRMNPNYPLFNEKLLMNNNNTNEVGINSGKPSYGPLMMNLPNNYYLLFNNNNIRRPLPQELLEEEPLYVNPKQYERIMKLRIKKAQKGMLKNSVMPLDRPKDSYKHLSRHLHAKRRERGTGGRFLSKEAQRKKDLEDMEALEREKMQSMEQGLNLHQLQDHPDFEVLRRNHPVLDQ